MQRPKIPEISGYFEIQAKTNVGFCFCFCFQILAKAMLLVISAFKEISVLSDIYLLFFFFLIYIAGNSNNFRYILLCLSLSPRDIMYHKCRHMGNGINQDHPRE